MFYSCRMCVKKALPCFLPHRQGRSFTTRARPSSVPISLWATCDPRRSRSTACLLIQHCRVVLKTVPFSMQFAIPLSLHVSISIAYDSFFHSRAISSWKFQISPNCKTIFRALFWAFTYMNFGALHQGRLCIKGGRRYTM